MSKTRQSMAAVSGRPVAIELVPNAAGNNGAGPDAPEWVKLWPAGVVNGTRTVVADTESAGRTLALFNSRKFPEPVVDYVHQTLLGESAAMGAPAAGWVRELDWRPGDGMYSRIDWTANGRAAVAAREYRYLSPVYFVDKTTGRIRQLHSVGLTNVPAIEGMAPILNAALNQLTAPTDGAPPQGGVMDREAMIAALGLEAGVGDDALAAALTAAADGWGEAGDESKMAIRVALGVAEGASDEDVTAALRSAAKELMPADPPVPNAPTAAYLLSLLGLQPGASTADARKAVAGLRSGGAEQVANSKVLGDQLEAANARIDELTDRQAERDARDLVVANASKISPARRQWAENFARKDADGFREWAKDAPDLPVANQLKIGPAPAAKLEAATDPVARDRQFNAKVDELVANAKASGKPIDRIDAMNRVANAHPELVADLG